MQNSAFSLVELSIVLVILGLLTGGVLTGQSLIRAAELRSVTSELSRYRVAVNVFNDKYLALPGDMPNAIEYWGDNTTICDDGDAGNNGSTGTCNGDGNGFIRVGWMTPNEFFMFWNHLTLANLISGEYSGISGALSPWDAVLGDNTPIASVDNNAGWTAFSGTVDIHPSGGRSWTMFADEYENSLILSGDLSVGAGFAEEGDVVTGEEAWSIDKKIDDGFPAKGKVWALDWGECTNATGNDDYSAEYEYTGVGFDGRSKICSLVFRDVF